mmetsp:Transcript_93951/g.304010  ORF Transcript_93951/g.304010 Transcript_93951/m.304010 type:complete len:898 (-) Transcript_93951:106-2799(-)|eukprot:CAMPEP_0203909914 /NCGR_PEP_ID=MMETSP0359-20131031/51169_1 /ASSEMBLY_ACC=CAM_ASM_000338 /TAXON_ID=268821 /ORGANISM="Scrippsiella Hangoei, Strain SHTV-5" /LENGTH=897 /DNA_ID=CAMNT_0050835247 /DNA_START=46 /DNA_END=2739 /DNA_ORIENTATION=+
MSSPSRNSERPVEDEDILADNEVMFEEEEGEDLFGENMAADYAERPELDQYDPDMLDQTEHEVMTVEQRMAAEQAMQRRDRAGRRRQRSDPGTPGFPSSSPGGGLSDAEGASSGPEGSTPGSGRKARSKRRRMGGEHTSEFGDADGLEDDDEAMPESFYDLTHEKLDETLSKNQGIEKRLETKIKRCFKQFILKFRVEGLTEPRYPDMLRKMAEENQMHLDVNYGHLQQWSAQLALWVADYPLQILPLLNQTLLEEAARKFGTYRAMVEAEETELRVAVHSFPVREPIRELSTRHLGKLISVNGVVTKRLKVNNEIKRLYLRCAKCNFLSPPFDVESDKDLKPGSCIECQSKGPWKVDRQQTLYRNHQKATIQESPSSVEPGKMPRSKTVILTGDQVDSVRPGDELQLTGIYKCLYDAGTNASTCFPVFRTEISAVHVHRRGDVKLIEITDDKQAQILELAKDPNIRERFIASMAPSIYGMKHVKTAIALSMMGGQSKLTAGKHRIRGDINTLIVGDPGLAKSQFLKYIEQTFPRAIYTTGKGASAVGLTAAVTKDENGDWGLEGGAMVMADDGMCLIDEFDKMNEVDRTSLHEAMEQQTISVSKAGIVATLKARCSVVAVANPTEGRYDPQRTFAQNVNLTDPILSRFDMLCVLRDESDPVQDERLADHVVCSHIRSHPDANGDDKSVQPKLAFKADHIEPIDQDLLKYYIVYARQNVFPKIADIDKEKLANFYRDLRAEAFRSGGQAMTARHVDSIVRLAEASARMELRQHVLPKDLDNAIMCMLESFIQSQKHQVAEELRKRFSRYIVKTVSPAEQFVILLDKMFKSKFEEMKLSRQGVAPELAEVGIEMADMARIVEQDDLQDLNMNEAQAFLKSQRFQISFRVEGERIFRMI